MSDQDVREGERAQGIAPFGAMGHASAPERDAVIGQIAHDFNNLLTPMLAYPELIRMDLPEGARALELLDVVEKAAQDMAHIAQQLLTLSGKGQQKLEPMDLNDVVMRVLVLLREEVETRNIEVKAQLADDLMRIMGSSGQLVRAVQNLCQNALDAVENAGHVRITTENFYADRPIMGRSAQIGVGEYVRLSVTDNGTGIPHDVQERIFEPFFTTRRNSKRRRGAGLGLSVVRSIMRDHGALVDFETTLGKGSTFSLFFPVHRDAHMQPPAAGAEPKVAGTALIVDDDAQQREIIAGLMRQHGYNTTCLPSGESALEFMAECAGVAAKDVGAAGRAAFPDVVVLDMVMDPGIDGWECCKRIAEINPRQKIVMVSGYNVVENRGVGWGGATVTSLDKPITWGKISAALSSLEDRVGPASADSGGERAACIPNRIMLVDDEEGIRKLFHMILSAALPKAEIDMAANGKEALEVFRRGHHAVLVMDLRMPIMDGRAAFTEIQSISRANKWEEPAVVFCTGFAPPNAVRELVAGQQKHCLLTKPVSGDDLVLAVKARLLSLR